MLSERSRRLVWGGIMLCFGVMAIMVVGTWRGAVKGFLLGAIGWKSKGPVVFEETRFDFGRLAVGEARTHKFRFTNIGNENVTFAKVQSSCGCVVGDIPRQAIKPGESSLICVKLSTNGMRPPIHLDKRLLIVFVQENVKPISLTLTGDVVPDLVVEPPCIKFMETAFDSVHAQEVRIRNEIMPTKSFASVALAVSEPYYEVTELRRTENEVHVSVRLLPSMAPLSLAPLSVAYEKNGITQTLLVPAIWDRVDTIKATPSAYVVAIDRAMPRELLRKVSTRRFVLTSTKHPALTVTSISVPTEANGVFEWEVETNTSNAAFAIWVKKVPENDQSVQSTLLRVFFQDRQTKSERHVLLNANILITGFPKSRRN